VLILSDTANSLAVAHDLREQGYDNLLDSQPVMRDAFIVLWQRGTSLREAHRQLTARFTDGHVPSVNALSTYVKKHLKQQTIPTRTPEYAELATKFDSVTRLYQIAYEAEARYKLCVSANVRMVTQLKMLNFYGNTVMKITEMELKLGLRTVDSSVAEPVISNSISAAKKIVNYNEEAMQLIPEYEAFRARVDAMGGKGVNVPPERVRQ
jgi:hypothetical protein